MMFRCSGGRKWLPNRWTTCLGLALVLALLLSARPAWAGYTVVYSGGVAVETNGTTTNYPYGTGTNNNSYGSSYMPGSWGTNQDANGNTALKGGVDASSTISATFTWNSGGYPGSGGGYPSSGGAAEDPPRAVVIAENCSTSWNASGTATGSSDNGLGFPEVRNAAGNAGSSSGTRYKIVQNPGQSFTITCSPKVVFSGTAAAGPPITGSGTGLGSLSYSATAQPLEVVLTGGIATDPKNAKRYLIGQQVTAALLTGGLNSSLNTYMWSVVGGDPFTNYTPSNSSALFTDFGVKTTNPINFYFKKPTQFGTTPDSSGSSSASVLCSAHLVVPPGALPAAGFDVLPSRTCVVKKPLNSLSAYIGTVQQYPAWPNSAQRLIIDGATFTESGQTYTSGILWRAIATTPPEFGTAGSPSWNFTQLITPGRRLIDGDTNITHKLVPDGVQVLDSAFAYANTSYSTDDAPHVGEDFPMQSCYGSPFIDLHVLDSFVTYTMYRPPGDGSMFVPLKNLDWYWQGVLKPITTGVSAPEDFGKWILSNPGSGWSFRTDFPLHPLWNRNVSPLTFDPTNPRIY